jgi:hypothetical protein
MIKKDDILEHKKGVRKQNKKTITETFGIRRTSKVLAVLPLIVPI